MVGAGAGFAGAIGGEATTGAATSRGAAAALGAGSGACMAGFTRVSLSLRLPNTMVLHAGYFLARSFSIKGDSNELFGFLVSPRPVSRCAICRNISVVR